MTKGNDNVTIDHERIGNVINRILKPQTMADRELMWTAIVMFALGFLIA